jgi:hypothetical protein
VANTDFEGGENDHGYGDYIFLVIYAQPSHRRIEVNPSALRRVHKNCFSCPIQPCECVNTRFYVDVKSQIEQQNGGSGSEVTFLLETL